MDDIIEFLKETSHSYELVNFEFDTLFKSVKNTSGILQLGLQCKTWFRTIGSA